MVCMSSGELLRPGNRFLLSCITFFELNQSLHRQYAFFIFRIIPHVNSIFRNLTGFCDFFRSTGLTVEIKGNSVFTVKL